MLDPEGTPIPANRVLSDGLVESTAVVALGLAGRNWAPSAGTTPYFKVPPEAGPDCPAERRLYHSQ